MEVLELDEAGSSVRLERQLVGSNTMLQWKQG